MKRDKNLATIYRTPDGIALRHIGGIYLLVPYKNISQIGCDRFMATNHVGAMIWQACKIPVSIQGVVDILKEKFNISEDELKNDVIHIIEAFKEYGLLLEVI